MNSDFWFILSDAVLVVGMLAHVFARIYLRRGNRSMAKNEYVVAVRCFDWSIRFNSFASSCFVFTFILGVFFIVNSL